MIEEKTGPGSASVKKTYHDPIPRTCKEALARWDAGELVYSVEMGGLGPGYEMAIQGLAFELIREGIKIKLAAIDDEPTPQQKEIWEKTKESVLGRLSGLPWAGFSNAQVWAAESLATHVIRRGYRAALRDEAVKDRLILVCRLDLRR